MRKGDSMFSPFREKIVEMCAQGLTCKQMLNELPEGYSRDSLYTYILVNDLRQEAWEKIYMHRNHCNECEYCKEFKNSQGFINKSEHYICTKSWRVIKASVRHCPRWCEKGGNQSDDSGRVQSVRAV